MRALEFSTSRMVRPSFSRSVRRLFPAGSTTPPRVGESYQRRTNLQPLICRKNCTPPAVTNSEHAPTLARYGDPRLACAGRRPLPPFCPEPDFRGLFGFRNKPATSNLQDLKGSSPFCLDSPSQPPKPR